MHTSTLHGCLLLSLASVAAASAAQPPGVAGCAVWSLVAMLLQVNK